MARKNNTNKSILGVNPVGVSASMRGQVYKELKKAIAEFDIYEYSESIRLDERQLAARLRVSRTPVREALALLAQDGIVRYVPRRGVFVVRKTKQEIVELVIVWAALESMAARLAVARATAEEIGALRDTMREFQYEQPEKHLSEYSSANITFHQQIIECSHSPVIVDMTSDLFIHVRAIRKTAIREDDRAVRSINEHLEIIRALEQRDADRAERLVREHALGLAKHIERYGDYLDLNRGDKGSPCEASDDGTHG